jgi:hypothetical protein
MRFPKIAIGVLSAVLGAAALVRAQDYDVVVYGGTSGGVVAAVQAKRMGKSVILVGPDKHLGGLTSGGLGWTDTGNKAVIGGLSREFYHRVWKALRSGRHLALAEKGRIRQQGPGHARDRRRAADDVDLRAARVAESGFEAWVKELNIPVHRDEWLDREKGREEVRRADHVDHDARAARPTPERCSSTPPTRAT